MRGDSNLPLRLGAVLCLVVRCYFPSVIADTSAGLGQHLTSFSSISVQDCFKRCVERAACRSLVYTRRATYCKLFDRTLSEYKLGRRTPGVVYKDNDEYHELGQPVSCHGQICVAGEICEEGSCRKSECQTPVQETDRHFFGNVRTAGAKIGYSCKNLLTAPVYSTCLEDGSWSDVDLYSCRTYMYVPSGSNTYQARYNYTRGFTLKAVYLEECLKRCNETIHCLGVNFFEGDRTCISTNVQARARVSNLDGWQHYSKNWPVSIHKNNFRNYEFTYEAGAAYCDAIGTKVAPIADVKLANDLGFGVCNCGWVDLRYAVLSLTANCGFYKPGVIKCWGADRFDVFCTNDMYEPW